ncbi:prephenate dehydratase [Actinopolymorpha pittospori]|uniref:Prephenate dehydratase n=1 Tax=Actinopolymorpha pittospori TaxID=648752 RepID=A0A927RIT5_9ACTN|nr:prephenate dehydratase [Actinopolymorpha pittospori]
MTDAVRVRYAYLGPSGTFTEAALRTVPDVEHAELLPCASVPAALEAVRSGEADGAVVPIENSVEGGVPVTLDELADGRLVITREILLRVSFALMARPGTHLEDCKRITTHPHAAAQTRHWVADHLPRAEVMLASSTAAAAAAVAEPGSEFDAAIAPRIAAEQYHLNVLADQIEDNRDAVTRFVLATRPVPPPPLTGADKTSLVAFIRDDHPGALLEILDEFAVRGVNLTRIESRPTGDGIGRYCFSIDCEGHVEEARVGEALMGLRRVCGEVRFLGSYPRADGARISTRPGTSDVDFRDAASWLASLKEGRT